jgi:C-terminal processing protease CtpA/Prc
LLVKTKAISYHSLTVTFFLTFKVGKVVTGSPANDAGVEVGDFLVSVNGQDVFSLDHASVVKSVKNAGKSLNLAIER